jgi:predicted metal-dependent enzyme (double-stranded beta helix superfamily)
MLHIAGSESTNRLRLDRKEALPTGPLGVLVQETACACDGPAARMAERIVPALAAAAADPSLVAAAQCQPHPEGYTRHALYGDPEGRFTILALVWDAGQFSPPHAHHAWCAYAVRTGILSETLYAYDSAAGLARPSRMAARDAGYACFAQGGLDQIHRLGNAGAEPAISIHVYGVARDRIATDVNRIVQVAPAEG